jgi:hypothetical protein
MQTANPVAQQQMQIVCPPGAMAGAMIQVNVNGQMMTVQVRAYGTPASQQLFSTNSRVATPVFALDPPPFRRSRPASGPVSRS